VPYDVILADPPWSYTVWTGKKSRTSDSKYPVMTFSQIRELPVSELVSDNCTLFLWVPPPILEDVFRHEIIQAWGFSYKTFAFTWIKQNAKSGGLATGMGHYTRANAEPCLLAVRGSMPVAHNGIPQVVLSPRTEHSRKPHGVYGRISKLYPDARKLELFARGPGESGWDVWGDGAENGIAWHV
jgi:N6-adenosine-specific RNA methylase IME4